MNKAPGLPLTVGLMGELVKNNKLGARWQLRGSKGLLWTLLPRGRMPSSRVPSFAAGSMGWGGLQKLAILLCRGRSVMGTS